MSYHPLTFKRSIAMPTSLVNLDALILREEFSVLTPEPNARQGNPSTLSITELEPSRVWHDLLRKPDFQRETANWDAQRVADLIAGFANGDLIPAVIMWKHPNGKSFVIDGAHRLRALIAWVIDDYGDQQTSRKFFENYIPPEQLKVAEKTRKLIKQSVGTYEELQTMIKNPKSISEDRADFARNALGRAIQLQWIPYNDSIKVEDSYLKINQSSQKIDPTEESIIGCRYKPNALATRSIVRAGTGHKYWSKFPDKAQEQIEKTARNIYDTLFKPNYETPIKTLELPIGGRGYSGQSVKMVFDFVNSMNAISKEMWETKSKLKNKVQSLSDDQDGSQTLRFLGQVEHIVSLIASNERGSLGLFPAVYFYGANGAFSPTAFLAVARFVRELETKGKFIEFTEVRADFEEFLLIHSDFLNQIGHEVITTERRVESAFLMYEILFEEITKQTPSGTIIERMRRHKELKFLRETTQKRKTYGKDFSGETKSAAYVREAMSKAITCSICHARVDSKSLSYDHIQSKKDGGLGLPENLQLTHSYCNNSKDRLESNRKTRN